MAKLEITNMVMIQNQDTGEVVVQDRAKNWRGIKEETEEGNVFWTSIDKLKNMSLAPNFKEYLPMFLANKYSEAYCSWNDDMKPDTSKENPWGIIYR